jgi:fructose-bisphosphate aldolase class II
MSIARMRDMLADARRGGYAIGYFEAWDQYSLEACLEAAELTRSPAILGFGAAVTDQAWLDRWGVEELTVLARRLAEAAAVPTAVLFNEARTIEQIKRSLDAGCNAVMLGSSHMPDDENREATRQVVALARPFSADVEVELGHLADARETDSHPTMTDPDQARRFVADTGVNALAVAVGSVHSMAGGAASLDMYRLAAIKAAVPVPLVLHGGSGIPATAIPGAIERGVAKINYGLRMKRVFLEGVQKAAAGVPADADIHAYIGAKTPRDVMVQGQARVRDLVSDLMRLYKTAGAAGKGGRHA